MEKKVTNFMQKHHLIKKDTTVLLGVSGGPDSMALLYYYLSLQEEWRLNLIVLAVDHQLRGSESQEDINYVKHICEREQVAFISASVNVPAYKQEKRLGTQVAAREMRYQYFERKMYDYQADYLALGHHGDDQIETMFMSMSRTSNPSALAGIPVKRSFARGFIVRPLLCVTKQEIERYCKEKDITPRIDPSNMETDYTRNYFRKHIVPLVKERNHNIHTRIQRLSEAISEDERYLQEQAKEMLQAIVQWHQNKQQASFKINLYKSYPLSLQRRCYHLILNYLYNQLPKNLTSVHEDILFELLSDHQANAQVDFPQGLKVEKSYDLLTFSFIDISEQRKSFQTEIDIPSKIKLPDGGTLEASYITSPIQVERNQYICEVNEEVLPLQVRTRNAGDRMVWKGLKGSKKLKDIFIDAKVPRQARDTWPIVTDKNDQILWLIDLRKNMQVKDKKGSSYILLEYESK